MLFPVKNLIEGQDGPEVILESKTVREALIKMVQYDYSQLPVINSEGNLIGIISDQTISRNLYLLDEKVSILELPVNHCLDDPNTLSPDADVFVALDRLENTFALVIVDKNKPVGIITDYDTTHFFRDLTEGLILVRDIEETIRQIIESTYTTEEALNQALINEFGSKGPDNIPRKAYDHMTFGNYMYFIKNPANWPSFEKVFYSEDLFFQYMEQVRNIRNQLAHFRGKPDMIQYEALKKARTWLANRPRPHKQGHSISSQEIEGSGTNVIGSGSYAGLENLLTSLGDRFRSGQNAELSFSQLEEILPKDLSSSAWDHRSWWSNDPVSGNQAYAWLRAGWLVDDVDFKKGIVSFQRTNSARYYAFYADTLVRLKEARPNVTQATKTNPYNYWFFGGGRTGFQFGWEFKKGDKFHTELYIDTGDKEVNKAAFDELYAQKNEIEAEFGDKLNWRRLNQKKACLITYSHNGVVTDSWEELDTLKDWAVETMLKFVDIFQKRIRKLKN